VYELYLRKPHCLAFGGFELQMLAAMESAWRPGRMLLRWIAGGARRLRPTALLGEMGLDHGYTVTWGNEAGKKPYSAPLVDYPGWKSWLRHQAPLLMELARLLESMLATVGLHHRCQ